MQAADQPSDVGHRDDSAVTHRIIDVPECLPLPSSQVIDPERMRLFDPDLTGLSIRDIQNRMVTLSPP